MKTIAACLVVALCLLPSAFAFQNETQSETFSDASKAPSYLRFDINTKKLGFIKSHVTGYVRKFKAEGRIEGNKLLTGARLEFGVREMDTDLYARNDQMWNYCLGHKETPLIEVKIPNVEFSEGKAQKIAATIKLRGKEKTLPLELTMEKKDGHWVASGKGETSFKDLEVPDPSIGVASVDGPIGLEFHIVDLSK